MAGKPLTISAVDLLGNDVAGPNGLKLSIGSVGNPTNGSVTLNSNGSVTFTSIAEGAASFTYTDTDADSDASTIATVTLNVKLGSTIHWSDPTDIVYGTPLSTTQLDATASVPGTFKYGPAVGTILNARNDQKLVVTFTPTDTTDYAGSTLTVHINVLQATPFIDWIAPAAIVHGTPLSAAQLDATASVPGTFRYIPAAGTLLPPRNGQTLTAVFTPFDTTDFAVGYATTTVNVEPAPPPGLTVQTHSLSGRAGHKVSGLVATLHTTLSKLKTNYYTALINWDDGVVQHGSSPNPALMVSS